MTDSLCRHNISTAPFHITNLFLLNEDEHFLKSLYLYLTSFNLPPASTRVPNKSINFFGPWQQILTTHRKALQRFKAEKKDAHINCTSSQHSFTLPFFTKSEITSFLRKKELWQCFLKSWTESQFPKNLWSKTAFHNSHLFSRKYHGSYPRELIFVPFRLHFSGWQRKNQRSKKHFFRYEIALE